MKSNSPKKESWTSRVVSYLDTCDMRECRRTHIALYLGVKPKALTSSLEHEGRCAQDLIRAERKRRLISILTRMPDTPSYTLAKDLGFKSKDTFRDWVPGAFGMKWRELQKEFRFHG